MMESVPRSEHICDPGFEKLKFSPKPPSAKGVWVKCQTCGRPFYVFPSRLRAAERKGHVIRYCSLACRPYEEEFNPFWRKHHREESITKMMEHPNHPVFTSGPTNPNAAQYGPDFRGKTSIWWRQYLIATVGKCERCGYNEHPGVLQIHHVDRNRRRNQRDNLQLLCPTCHAIDHFLAEDGPFKPGPTLPNSRAVLSEAQVREIRTRFSQGGITRAILAEEYGVSSRSIRNVLSGRTWKVLS